MLPVRFSRGARNDIERALAWWARNREKAPGALREDIEEAARLLSNSLPRSGSRGVRRIYLPRVRYYLYYRVVGSPPTQVEVVALWHASRSARTVREPAVAYADALTVKAFAA